MMEKRKKPHRWLPFALLCLVAALGAAAVLAMYWLVNPRFHRGTLPALPEVTALGWGTVWSLDSRQLLLDDGRLYIARFPERTVTRLPDLAGPGRMVVGFDAKGSPLVRTGLAPGRRLLRLGPSGSWEAIAGPAVSFSPSPDGRYVAVRERERLQVDARDDYGHDRVTLRRLTDLMSEALLRTPGRPLAGIGWIGPDRYVHGTGVGDPRRAGHWWEYRTGQGRFIHRKGIVPMPRAGAVQAGIDVRKAPHADAVKPLQREIPAVSTWELYDVWLIVTRPGDRRELFLGRQTRGFTRTPPAVSPDGRWVVVGAPDHTVRVLDLGSSPPSGPSSAAPF